MRKIYWRILPLVLVSYFLCYLDRINVGFAALTMNKDLGLDSAIYGMAAGMFFWGYFLFEVPSNIILEKVGARVWIARIMVSWGVLSGATALCTGPWSFTIMRFLLGLAEAGLFPGVVLFLTYWFPNHHRARVMAWFTMALPIAVAAGAPVSTALLQAQRPVGAGRLEMDVPGRGGANLARRDRGASIYLADRPREATWLSADERAWLAATLEAERAADRRAPQDQRVAVVLGSEGATADGELSRHRHGQPGVAAVPAADGEAARLQHDGSRLGDHDPLSLRRDQHGALGLVFGPGGRAALEPVLRVRARLPGARHRRPYDRVLLGADRNDDRDGRALWQQGPVLVHAADVSDGHGGGLGHRLDQLDRQSRRVLRPVGGRLGARHHRQRLRRALLPGGIRAHVGGGFRILARREPRDTVPLGGARAARS